MEKTLMFGKTPNASTEYDMLMRRSTLVSQNNKIGVKRPKIRKSLGFANTTNKVIVVKIGIMMLMVEPIGTYVRFVWVMESN